MTSTATRPRTPAVVLTSLNPGLAVIRALGERGVPVTAVYHSTKEFAYASKYVRQSLEAPHPERQEEQFIDFLLSAARKPVGSLAGGLLIPTSDESLAAVARHKELLEEHYIVAGMEWAIAERFIDKRYTYSLAEELGVPSPRSVVPGSPEDVEEYARHIEYPCLVKPTQGHQYFEVFGRKMVKAYDLDQLIAAYTEASAAGLDVMVQEFIPGNDTHGVNYNAYIWGGKALAECTAEKVRLTPPEIGFPRVVLSKIVPEVLQAGRTLLEAMGVYGFACTEFKRDARDGVYKLMEVNGRHNLSSSLSIKCGVNFPWIMYEHLVLGRLPSPVSATTGVYWIAESDIVKSIKYASRERYKLGEYVRPYVNDHVFATFDRKDIKPLVTRFARLGSDALRRRRSTKST